MYCNVPCRLVSWCYFHTVQPGWCSVVSAAAAAAAGTHRHAAAVPADAVAVPTRCAAVPRDVGLALSTSVSVEPLHCVTSRVLDPTQTYTVHTTELNIYSLESIRPNRTAENFEAVEWATGFSNKNGCIVGLIDTAAGQVTSFYVIFYVILLK